VSDRPPQRNLILILARDFASRLATAVFLVDAKGSVIYFNEAAERLLGVRFVEGPGMTAQEWSTRFSQVDEDGNPISLEDNPLAIAFRESRPNHRTMHIKDTEGGAHHLAVTAFPLVAHAGEIVGALAIFWESPA